jgi:hypothetical protein
MQTVPMQTQVNIVQHGPAQQIRHPIKMNCIAFVSVAISLNATKYHQMSPMSAYGRHKH